MPGDALAIARQVADALHAAHAEGIAFLFSTVNGTTLPSDLSCTTPSKGAALVPRITANLRTIAGIAVFAESFALALLGWVLLGWQGVFRGSLLIRLA